MLVKAPLEYVWRPLFAWIASVLRTVASLFDGLLLPILIWGAAIFLIIFWVLSV